MEAERQRVATAEAAEQAAAAEAARLEAHARDEEIRAAEREAAERAVREREEAAAQEKAEAAQEKADLGEQREALARQAELVERFRGQVQLPPEWMAMGSEDPRVVPVEREEEPQVWDDLQARVNESLPDFEVISVQRVQNPALWRMYCTDRDRREDELLRTTDRFQCDCFGCEGGQNEQQLFHYCKPDVVSQIVSSTTAGFETRVGGGEYGGGAYFAKHAIYSVAYGNTWLWGDFRAEGDASPDIQLLVGRACLGHCKDFGARCRSRRGDAAADEAGLPRNFEGDWGPSIGRADNGSDKKFERAPPHPERGPHDQYASVTGTEADLLWTQNPRLRDQGHEFGRQFVTFENGQAYPEFVLQLQRRPKKTDEFDRAREEEKKGTSDEAMAPNTLLFVKGHGHGFYQQFEFNWTKANDHKIRFGQQTRTLRLTNETWYVVKAADSDAVLAEAFRPERSRTQVTVRIQGWDIVTIDGKEVVQWITFVASPVLAGSTRMIGCIRQRWSECDAFANELVSLINPNLHSSQRFEAKLDTPWTKSFDEAELNTRMQELDRFLNAFAEWVTQRGEDGVNFFDPACEQDPNNIVVKFLTGNFNLRDSVKFGDKVAGEFRRRSKLDGPESGPAWTQPSPRMAALEQALISFGKIRPIMALEPESAPEPEPEPEPEPATDRSFQPYVRAGVHHDMGQQEPKLIESVPMAQRQYDFFINHCQKSGQDQCRSLVTELKARGCTVWYDMTAGDISEHGMEVGVSQSRNILMFLSEDLMARPFCQKEQRWGLKYGCKFIGVMEADDRHGKADFGKEKVKAPEDLMHLLDEVEFQLQALLEELCRRGDAPLVHACDKGWAAMTAPEQHSAALLGGNDRTRAALCGPARRQ